MRFDFLKIKNGQAADLKTLPEIPIESLSVVLERQIKKGGVLLSLFAAELEQGKKIIAVCGDPLNGDIKICSSVVEDQYPGIFQKCPQAHMFEREIYEQFSILPVNHPWLKPVRRTGSKTYDFFRLENPEIHQVAVGPVHAGVIEPGHFRFQCLGEQVEHLEISLGYQHRGVEENLEKGPDLKSVHYAETLAGDSSIAHAWAFAQAYEALAGINVSPRAQSIRAVALELERLANHTGDLGALANDIGYLPTSSYCGRLRGDLLNLTAVLCGNRFGRGLIRPGGVEHELSNHEAERIAAKLKEIIILVKGAVKLLWDEPSVVARFENTGRLSRRVADTLGLSGPVARACKIEEDARIDFPVGVYMFSHIPVAVQSSGDVFARAMVRTIEIERSARFIEEQLTHLPAGSSKKEILKPRDNFITVSLIEGWRGRVCHTVITQLNGKYRRYKVVDPSFQNWTALSMAMRGQEISDFPLCNKSFNLSYCGHDL
jgi:Ni,Fe-hydrogenase III large subunit